MSYQSDREWSDRHLPIIKRIIGPLLLASAPIERDRRENTDLIVLLACNMTIAVRLRRRSLGYWQRFPVDQFTLRCKRSGGAKTELSKIIDGWGHWLVYGHADDGIIEPWMVVDLTALRAAFQRYPRLLRMVDPAVSGVVSNGDGTEFAYFNRSMLPPDITLATSEPPQRRLNLGGIEIIDDSRAFGKERSAA